MTHLNDLRRRASAQPPPAEVTVTWNHVGVLLEHIRASTLGLFMDRAQLRSDLMAGKVKICGVPIRVVGVPAEVRQVEIDALEKRVK